MGPPLETSMDNSALRIPLLAMIIQLSTLLNDVFRMTYLSTSTIYPFSLTLRTTAPLKLNTHGISKTTTGQNGEMG